MIMGRRTGLMLAIFLTIALPCAAQSINEFMEKGLSDHDIAKKLPPLDTLFSWAQEFSPELNILDQEYDYQLTRQRFERKEWLKFFYLEGRYGYGVVANLNDQQTAGDAGLQTLQLNQQNTYYAGVSMKMPLTTIVNRKGAIRLAKMELEMVKYQRIAAEVQLKEIVEIRYRDLIHRNKLLFLSSASVDDLRVQSLRAEKDFVNGIINIEVYTRLQQMYQKALVSHVENQTAFSNAFSALERVIGVPLILE